MISEFFDRIEIEKKNREFHTITGYYKNTRFTSLSTGIGADNIDIVINELDALVNIDFNTYAEKKNKKSINLIRIGTSGAIQDTIPVNTYLLSDKSIGFDGLLNFYLHNKEITDTNFVKSFEKDVNWDEKFATPYVVDASTKLNQILSKHSKIKRGITITANGFYGPQGRKLRLNVVDKTLNSKLTNFEYQDKYKLTNFEMESAALFGLARLLGHEAACICLIIANRITQDFSKDYKLEMKKMIQFVLNSFVQS